MISNSINEYIDNSKINGKLCKWQKSIINVYVMPIVAQINDKNFYYSEIARAINVWNGILKQENINHKFYIVLTPQEADIIIHWTKVGRVFEGMCKYLSVVGSVINKISIEVGLYNSYSPKNTSDESIFFTMMHEFGHSLGLGHGVEVDDVMFVPHQKNISIPSENDIYVLNQIYKG